MTSTSTASVGTLIRAHRERAGLTQRQLAEAAGVTVSYISDVENGRKHPSKPETIRAIAETLGVDPDELFHSGKRIPDDVLDWLRSDVECLRAVRALMGLEEEERRDIVAIIEKRYPADYLRWFAHDDVVGQLDLLIEDGVWDYQRLNERLRERAE